MYPFEIGREYKRKDIFEIIGVPGLTSGGNWFTGYNKYRNDYFGFAEEFKPSPSGTQSPLGKMTT